ncbi:alpha-amylase family glycosyl hydrolase [Ferruginibacter sp.]|nr:cyclomaltodextrinase C-terminal domain-containing protein [Ferruginibacter sp.]
MKKTVFSFVLLCATLISFAQYNDAYKCIPANWWAGMKMNKIQLMLSGDAIGNADGYTINYPGITVTKVTKAEKEDYAFVDITIALGTKPGIVKIIPKNFRATDYVQFEIKPRRKNLGKDYAQGVSSKDFVYLLMPDRFSNGDSSNDAFTDLRDTDSDRSNKFARHGGDLAGIVNHLDYLKDLGATAVWCTPLVENDMPKMREDVFDLAGFHGYWFTDHYTIDKRYGGNEAYKSMIAAAHAKGLKVIHDAVYNHIGLYHWINLNPPSKDWINQWPEFTPPSHRDASLFDPYRSTTDNSNMLKGWFVKHLPDLNLANPFVATYLIQNAIWLTEEFGLDGFRVDTYKYCDERFLNNVNTALLKEFPAISTFAEGWGNDVMANAYFARNNLDIPFKHNAMGALDFPLCFAIQNSLNQPAGWTEGINKLYLTLAEDFAYKEPLNNCIFLDNHDMNRFYSVVNEDFAKYKMGMAMLLTMRGIPQLYYGDEVLMKNFKNPTDQDVRLDFPGGWAGDPNNKFTAAGRTPQENEAFNYVKTLANFRKKSSALTTGKTMQFIPQNGVYVYFRYDNNQTVMVISNTAKEEKKITVDRFAERTKGFTKFKNIITNTTGELKDFNLGSYQTVVYELLK